MDFEKRIKDLTENQTKLLKSLDDALTRQTELIANIRNLIADLDLSILEDHDGRYLQSNTHRALKSQEKVFDTALDMIKGACSQNFAAANPAAANFGRNEK